MCSCRTREAAVVFVPAMSNRSLTDSGTPCSGPRYRPAAISRSASRACSRASLARTVMNALRVPLRSAIRCRQRSTTASTVISRALIARARAAMDCSSGIPRFGVGVELAGGIRVPFGGSERGSGLGQRLEQRLQLGKAAALRIVNGHFEPRFNGHGHTAYSDVVRHTKMVATVGPSSDSDEMIRALIAGG